MEVEKIKVESLTPYARNARTHSPDQVAQIAGSIKEFGFCNPVLIDNGGGIIAGHGRVLAAQKMGLPEVPCIRLGHLTDVQRRAYILADNRLAMNAGWDDEMLSLEIEELDSSGFNLEILGFTSDELSTMLGVDPQGGETDPDDIPDVPTTPTTRNGDVWLLGVHKLMCGDSAAMSDVNTLMGGELADLVVTDPPYGVAYVGKTKNALTVDNDDVTPDKLRELCSAWFNGVDAALRGGGYILATVPAGPLHLIFAHDWQQRGWLRQILVWNKDSMVLGHSEYHYKHEPILFGWKPGGERMKNTDRTRTTVWDYDRPKASRIHPTMKPVEMWVFAIENHSSQGDLLFEPFSGSGTSIIAAEQSGRRCYAIECAPQYVDVAVNRWEQFTGGNAILEATGQKFGEVSLGRV